MSILDIPSAVRRIIDAVENRRRGYVCVTGVHGIMESRTDKSLRYILNNAFLCTPDGMPTVWMGKLSGHPQMSRVYGPDLMLAVMDATRDKPVRHFFYGGQEGVAEELKTKLEQRFSGVQITGVFCPPFRSLNAEELRELQEKVRTSRADIVWVGLSTPKQERFMAGCLPKLDTSVMIGVGAAFDFHSGRVKQAPLWIQRNGLEWLHRVAQEPKRLWRRYFNIVPRFIFLVFADKALGRSAFDGLGCLLFRLLPWLTFGGIAATPVAAALHPELWVAILATGATSIAALVVCGMMVLGAAEEANATIFPVLPWLAATVSAALAAIGAVLGNPWLMRIALHSAASALLVWLVLILAAGLVAWLRKGNEALA